MTSNEILTQRLHLRRLQPTDMDDYYRCIYADPEVMRYLPAGAPLSREQFEQRAPLFMIDHWREHGFGLWVIRHRENDNFVGHCGLKYWPDSEDVEVLYAVARDYWKQGLATEAARACLEYGFTQLSLKRIIAGVFPNNIASRRVLEKIGMSYQGQLQLGEWVVLGYEISADTPDL